MMDVTKEEIIKRLNSNTAAGWVLFEARNLMNTFEGYLDGDEKDIPIKTITRTELNHRLSDTIENLVDTVIGLIYPEEQPEEENYDAVIEILDVVIPDTMFGDITWKLK